MLKTHAGNFYSGTTLEREALDARAGSLFYDTDLNALYWWNGEDGTWNEFLSGLGALSGDSSNEISTPPNLFAIVLWKAATDLGVVGDAAGDPIPVGIFWKVETGYSDKLVIGEGDS